MLPSLKQRPSRSRTEEFLPKDLGDEYIVLDRKADQVHVLNGTAREVYLLCDGKRSVDQIAAALVRRYEIGASTARRDTERTVRRLIDLGLIELV